MKIEKIQLKNIRSYDQTTVNFDSGTILLYGQNGAGKSTILNSIFAGLYQSKYLNYVDTDLTLDSIVKQGKNQGKILVQFSIQDEKYTVEWKISVDEEQNASTKSCTLTSDTTDTIEGVTNVRNKIEDLLGMTAESFVNSVYIQQGDISNIVNKGSKQRKKIIDNLLGMNDLDTYISRMDKVRLALRATKREKQSLIENKIEKKNEKQNLQELKNEIKTNKEVIQDNKQKLTNINNKIKEKENKIQQLQTKIDDYNETQEKINSVEQNLQNAKQQKEQYEQEIQQLQSKKQEKQEQLQNINLPEQSESSLQQQLESINNQIQEQKNQKQNYKQEKQQKEQEKSITEETINTKQEQLENTNKNISNIQSELQEIREKISIKKESISEIRQEITEKQEQLDRIRDVIDIDENEDESIIDNLIKNSVEKGKSLQKKYIIEHYLQNGACDVCQSETETVTYDKSKIDKQIDEYDHKIRISKSAREQREKADNLQSIIEQKKTKKESKQSELNTHQSQLEDRTTKLDEYKSQKQKLQQEINEQKEKKQKLENKIKEDEEKIEQLRNAINNKQEKRKQVDEKINQIHRKKDLYDEIENLDEKINSKQEIKQTHQRQYQEYWREKQELNEKIDQTSIENINEKIQRLQSEIEEHRNKKSKIKDTITQKERENAQNEQEIDEIRTLEKEINNIESDKQQLSKYKQDAETVIETYNNIKTEFRTQNLQLLNKYISDVFMSIYQNRTYQNIKITDDYAIHLVTTDGNTIQPNELSGGEKTMISLAMRAGIYRLLSERKQQNKKLPPFLLDEPTTYLDNTHISNIKNFIQKIKSWDMEQVFIVSHEENLIHSADTAYNVQKEMKNSTSTVTKQNKQQ